MKQATYLSLNAQSMRRGVISGQWTVRELVEAALERLDEVNPGINAFTVVRRDEALAEADALDRADLNRECGPLYGVPIAVKEEYDVAGLPTTLGGRGNTRPVDRDSEAIRRVREAGAVIIGKTTMPEFGQFTDTESERYGVTRNPVDLSLSPGGSSGGSAAAVAAGIVPIALAADGGGSIRVPAACCGIYGLKPARGRVSPAPLREHWHGLVTLGAVTRTIEDTATVNDILAGGLPEDSFSAESLVKPHEEGLLWGGRPLRVAVSVRSVLPGVKVDPQVEATVLRLAGELHTLGHDVRIDRRCWPVPSLPFFVQFLSGMAIEASSVQDYAALEHRTKVTSRAGRFLPSSLVRWALRASERLAERIDERFLRRADVVLMPTMPIPVPDSGVVSGKSTISALLATSPMVANTAIFNVSGHPAMSIPARVGLGEKPVGVQLICRPGNEFMLVALASQLSRAAGEIIVHGVERVQKPSA